MRVTTEYGLAPGQVGLNRTACRIDQRHHAMVSAKGRAGCARVATGKPGEGRNEIRDEIAALKRRVQELEAQQ